MAKYRHMPIDIISRSISITVVEKGNLLVDPFPGDSFSDKDRPHPIVYTLNRPLLSGGSLGIGVIVQPDEKDMNKRVQTKLHISSQYSADQIDTLETGLSGEFQKIEMKLWDTKRVRQSLHPDQVDYWQRCYDKILRTTYDILNIRKPIEKIA